MGGSVFPELPHGMRSRGGWRVTEEAGETDRRSIYIFVRRNTRYPILEAFDMPDTHESCGRRRRQPARSRPYPCSTALSVWTGPGTSLTECCSPLAMIAEAQVRSWSHPRISRLPTRPSGKSPKRFWQRQAAILRRTYRGDELPVAVAGPKAAHPIGAAVLASVPHAAECERIRLLNTADHAHPPSTSFVLPASRQDLCAAPAAVSANWRWVICLGWTRAFEPRTFP